MIEINPAPIRDPFQVNGGLTPSWANWFTRAYRVLKYSDMLDVRKFGAAANGSDDAAAIQGAINEAHGQGGGAVYFPVGSYNRGSSITLYPNVALIGAAYGAVTIQDSTTGLTWSGVDCDYLHLENLIFKGPGIDAVSGGSFSLTRLNNDNLAHLVFRNVLIRDVAGTGLFINTPIMSTFDNTKILLCAGNGFHLYSGTSCVLRNCYGITTTQSNFYFDTMAYSALIGCAAEVGGIGYNLQNSYNISLVSCGAEAQINRSAGYEGKDYVINGGGWNHLLNCSSREPANRRVVVSGNADNCEIDGFRCYGVNPATELEITNTTKTVLVNRSNFTNISDVNLMKRAYQVV